MTVPRSVDVGILTTRPAEMMAFYTQVLGLTHAAHVDTALGPMDVLVFGSSRVKLVTQDDDSTAGPGPARHYLTFETDDLPTVWQRAVAAGAEPVAVPAPISSGAGTVAMVRDPDGSLVELIQRTAPPG